MFFICFPANVEYALQFFPVSDSQTHLTVCQDPRKPQPMVQEKPKTEDTAPSISVESCYARGWCGMGTRCRLCQSPNPLERPKCYCVTERFGYQDSRKPQPLVHDQLKTEDSMPSISWCDSRL